MIRIGLISDTHGFLDDAIFKHFENCDEIWHAGDFGNLTLANQLLQFRPLKGVYGNIDGPEVRAVYPEEIRWKAEDVNVFMKHIGGYPGRYATEVKAELTKQQTQLFICGHSHILKVIYDEKFHCLHMNPGAAGKQGWHKQRTVIRFVIEGKEMKKCEVIELSPR